MLLVGEKKGRAGQHDDQYDQQDFPHHIIPPFRVVYAAVFTSGDSIAKNRGGIKRRRDSRGQAGPRHSACQEKLLSCAHCRA